MLAAEFRAARDLQIHVELPAAIDADELLDQLPPLRLAVGIANLQFAQAAREACQVGLNLTSPTAAHRDHLVHAVAKQEAAIQRRDARLAQRQQRAVEVTERQRLGHCAISSETTAPRCR
jgi:hypothetical protein